MNDKKKRIIILAIIVIVILIVVLLLCTKLLKESTPSNPGINPFDPVKTEETSNKEKTQTTDEYIANIYFDGDHYVLNVKTNIVSKEFEFSYDSQNFLLNSTSSLFSNSLVSKADGFSTHKIMLENNTVYEFSFIKRGEVDLAFGKTINIK